MKNVVTVDEVKEVFNNSGMIGVSSFLDLCNTRISQLKLELEVEKALNKELRSKLDELDDYLLDLKEERP